MWNMIPSLVEIVAPFAPVFTQPSFHTHCDLILAWIMCLGSHNLRRVAYHRDPRRIPDHSHRHGLDTTYNFFERSAWEPDTLAKYLLLQVVQLPSLLGVRITLLVDDTLAHKRGKSVWGLGWFRDAVASTKKRVATASGHNWVVLAVAVCLPGDNIPILAIPILARLHLPGKTQPSCAALAKMMLADVLTWLPNRSFTLVADGAYACKGLLADLDPRIAFVGRMRGDAAVYDPRVPAVPKGKKGPKPTKGPTLPKPKEAAAKADRQRSNQGPWLWQEVSIEVYGCLRTLQVVTYEAVWPRVLGLRRIQIVVVRDPSGRMADGYLFATDLAAAARWVATPFAWRWSIEVVFRASKQELEIASPQQGCQESVEKVAPWVWALQGIVTVWYIQGGQQSLVAQEMRERLGEWDSEWSMRHMVAVLRRSILDATINSNSEDPAQLQEYVKTLKNWVNLAA